MYPGEEFGLTHGDYRLIMSDGSSKSRFLDETFVEMGRLKRVRRTLVNELKFVEGEMYANVLPQDRIAIIQPDTGQVTGWIDLVELKSRMPPLHNSLCLPY